MAEANLNYQTIKTTHAAREAVRFKKNKQKKFFLIKYVLG
jgi:hypothetical protein